MVDEVGDAVEQAGLVRSESASAPDGESEKGVETGRNVELRVKNRDVVGGDSRTTLNGRLSGSNGSVAASSARRVLARRHGVLCRE